MRIRSRVCDNPIPRDCGRDCDLQDLYDVDMGENCGRSRFLFSFCFSDDLSLSLSLSLSLTARFRRGVKCTAPFIQPILPFTRAAWSWSACSRLLVFSSSCASTVFFMAVVRLVRSVTGSGCVPYCCACIVFFVAVVRRLVKSVTGSGCVLYCCACTVFFMAVVRRLVKSVTGSGCVPYRCAGRGVKRQGDKPGRQACFSHRCWRSTRTLSVPVVRWGSDLTLPMTLPARIAALPVTGFIFTGGQMAGAHMISFLFCFSLTHNNHKRN